MFSDPQSVTINAVAQSLARVSMGTRSGEFLKDDGLVGLQIAHQIAKRTRHNIRINHAKVGPDPFNGTLNAKYSLSAYLVVDVPPVGYTLTEQKQVVDGFLAYLTASSGANVTKILAGES